VSQAVVSRNKVVSVTYTLRNQHGELFEQRDLPVSYLHGSGADLFPEIEQALNGKPVGARVTITLGPEQAFGAHDPKLAFTDDIENVPPELRRLGAEFEAENAKGEARLFVVTRIENGKLTVDANHPLAGQTVTFDVTVVAIRDATQAEISSGRPSDSQPLQ
jgi:FKBP-type peptidyl-prolyl cis-trans isomerase SlyD